MLEEGHADGLVVVKLDRLTRSLRDLGELVDRYFAFRFSLLSLADSIDTRTASGRLVLHVLRPIVSGSARPPLGVRATPSPSSAPRA